MSPGAFLSSICSLITFWKPWSSPSLTLFIRCATELLMRSSLISFTRGFLGARSAFLPSLCPVLSLSHGCFLKGSGTFLWGGGV